MRGIVTVTYTCVVAVLVETFVCITITLSRVVTVAVVGEVVVTKDVVIWVVVVVKVTICVSVKVTGMVRERVVRDSGQQPTQPQATICWACAFWMAA